jgi:hypothetical protein
VIVCVHHVFMRFGRSSVPALITGDYAMNKVHRGLGVAAVATAFAVFAFGAQAQAPMKKSPACKSLKEEGACKARDECTWVAAVVDAKTQKEKRKGYCRAMPKASPKKK